jgi:hypothetical protein
MVCFNCVWNLVFWHQRLSLLVSKIVDIILSQMKYNVKPNINEMPAWGCRYFRFVDYNQKNSLIVLGPG